MNRNEYEFTKRAARDAYEQAIRDMEGSGGGAPEDHEHDDDYIHRVEDTKLGNTVDKPFLHIKTKRPKDDDGNWYADDFGLEIDLDEGNTYRNQFVVGTERNGYALRVLGGTGRNVQIGGDLRQRGGIQDNENQDHYIVRKNMEDALEPLQEHIDHNEDRINALEHELEAIADVKVDGEWELVSLLDFDIRGEGQMTMADDRFSQPNNEITLLPTDLNGITHGWSNVEVGDYMEVVQEHRTRDVGDYGLYKITEIIGSTFRVELDQGSGTADLHAKFIVRFFTIADNDLDLSGLDGRYVSKSGNQDIAQGRWYLRQQNAEGNWRSYIDIKADGKLGLYHVQNPSDDAHAVNRGYLNTELAKKANTHSHPYASSTHTHDYASDSHTHSGYASSSHTHSGLNATIRTGTSNSPTLSVGEMYLNTNYGVVWVGY